MTFVDPVLVLVYVFWRVGRDDTDSVDKLLGVLFGLFESLTDGDIVPPADCVNTEDRVEFWDPLRFDDFDTRGEIVLEDELVMLFVTRLLAIILIERTVVLVPELPTVYVNVPEPVRVCVICDEPVCV